MTDRLLPPVRDGNTVRVERQVLEDVGGATERCFGVDHPIHFSACLQQRLEGLGLAKRFDLSHLDRPSAWGIESRHSTYVDLAPGETGGVRIG